MDKAETYDHGIGDGRGLSLRNGSSTGHGSGGHEGSNRLGELHVG